MAKTLSRRDFLKAAGLSAIAAAVPRLGHSRVNPSEYLSPRAQATSNRPASSSARHPFIANRACLPATRVARSLVSSVNQPRAGQINAMQ